MDLRDNGEIPNSHVNRSDVTEVDERNMTNTFRPQSSHAYNLGSLEPRLPNPFSNINPHQNTMPNQFPMGYGFQSTNFNPHFQQACSFQGLMNPSMLHFETHPEAPSQKKRKKQKSSPNFQNKDFEHLPIRRNWTKEEDVALTKAWLHISIDPIIGTDQSSDTMWKRIHAVWKEYLTDDFIEDRPIAGLTKRWCTIQGAVNKFHGAYEQCLRAPQSGTNVDDLKRDAHRVYMKTSVGKKPFLFEHCWDECKKNAKWCIQMTSSSHQKTNSSSPPTSNASSSPTSNETITVGTIENKSPHMQEIPRPPGRKVSKEKKKMQCQDNSMMEVFNKIHESMEQQYSYNQEELELRRENCLIIKKEYELKEQAMKKELELKEKELLLQEKELALQKEAQRRRNQQKILNQDLSKLGPAAREKMEKMQERILEEWDEEDD